MIGRLNMFCEDLFEMLVGEAIWSQWEIAQMKIQIQIRGIFLPRALRNPVYDIKPRPAVITLIKIENWWERNNCEGSFFSSVTTKTNPNCEIHRSQLDDICLFVHNAITKSNVRSLSATDKPMKSNSLQKARESPYAARFACDDGGGDTVEDGAGEKGIPGGSVHGERANFTGLVLGCIEVKFASRYSRKSYRRDLHNALLCTVL